MRNPNSRVPDPTTFRTPFGSRIKVKYEGRFDGSSFSLVKVGQVDTQDIINSYGPFTDINFMLHRLSVGDRSVLSQRSPLYGDFTELPNNPIDAINLVHSAEARFLDLPLEDRQKFNNDYRVWLADLFGKPSGHVDGANSNSAGSEFDENPVDKEVTGNES